MSARQQSLNKNPNTRQEYGLTFHIYFPDLYKGVRKSGFIPQEHVFYSDTVNVMQNNTWTGEGNPHSLFKYLQANV